MFKGSDINDENLAQLIEMGFDIKEARKALKQFNNELDKALEHLVEQKKESSKMAPP